VPPPDSESRAGGGHLKPLASLRLVVLCLPLALAARPASADVVTDWNHEWRNAVRATGGPPGPIARAGAMTHAAIYDAVNAIDGGHEAYVLRQRAPGWASEEAAAATAAHDVLCALYPARTAGFDAALAASLAAVPDGPGKHVGMAVGRDAAR